MMRTDIGFISVTAVPDEALMSRRIVPSLMKN